MAAANSSSKFVNELFNVVNKNVLITGGSRGIGEMIANGFVKSGANVIIASRDEKACSNVAKRIGCDYVAPANVSTRDGCKELVKEVGTRFNGKLDVLINNAGTSWGEEVYDKESSTKSNWGFDKVLDLNVKGLFYLTRECVPLMERQPSTTDDNKEQQQEDDHNHVGILPYVVDPARVINIGSITGFMPQHAPSHAYDISKAAVHHLTRKMSADLSSRGITVNAIAPGFVPSRMSSGLQTWGADFDNEETLKKIIPLGRMGCDTDMVGASLFLSSKAGAWCTGIVIPVDGGTIGTMQIPISNSNL